LTMLKSPDRAQRPREYGKDLDASELNKVM
jgi:hypothetical protein